MHRVLVPLAALSLALPAQAAALFFDDFEAEGAPNTLNYTGFADWTVDGQVDLVGMPNGFGITCMGNCVDLDGSPGPGGITSIPIAFAAGRPVRIQFDLSGSQRSPDDDDFEMQIAFADPTDLGVISFFLPPGGAGSLPPIDNVIGIGYGSAVPGTMPWGTWHLTFRPLEPGSITVRFGTTSSDFFGPLLDNVRVSVIPEPATWAMLIAGFGLVGTALRRRKPLIAA
ncbi:MAG: PEPxxWA-CTERM sorting domain-containing protein [Sphingomonadaceae bacterium]|uniref:PEPxxWA-CTERM sorting domain-containing protein n=1 Tax=Thermaurantiacus sp. TaxID=2820283 RepID=UPI00298EEA3A|nr:PEPxxWA-CTERM sorting domain-containing protein [Thermaurantiacus sp.]MCS6987441.1 PEPxxWA-CTERM sorting domain-containing protein [Sphingomonadaceae bacterium]MDW8415361.1 PEPxxWA-CTERM sorting domain-containing protein [Thermaurantiacus sp.]